jgi:hypothetical protein
MNANRPRQWVAVQEDYNTTAPECKAATGGSNSASAAKECAQKIQEYMPLAAKTHT